MGPGECVSPTIEEGRYTLIFTHDGISGPATFVLEPLLGETGVSETGISANYSQEDLDRLKKTNQCPNCDLSGLYLRHMNLSGANLEMARLDKAKLIVATWINGSKCGAGSIGRCIPERSN